MARLSTKDLAKGAFADALDSFTKARDKASIQACGTALQELMYGQKRLGEMYAREADLRHADKKPPDYGPDRHAVDRMKKQANDKFISECMTSPSKFSGLGGKRRASAKRTKKGRK